MKCKIAAGEGREPNVCQLRKKSVIGTVGTVAGIPGEDGSDAGSIAAVPAGDVFLVKKPTRGIGDRTGML